MHEQWFDRTAAKDLDGLMEHIAPDIVSYEHAGPLQYTGIDDVREACRRGLESSPGRIDFDSRSHGSSERRPGRGVGPGPDRCQRRRVPLSRHPCLRAAQRQRQMVHQHLSIPVTGE